MSPFSFVILFVIALFQKSDSQFTFSSHKEVIERPERSWSTASLALAGESSLRERRKLLANGTNSTIDPHAPCFSFPKILAPITLTIEDPPLTHPIDLSGELYFTVLQGDVPNMTLLNNGVNPFRGGDYKKSNEVLKVTPSPINEGKHFLLLIAENNCGQATQQLELTLTLPPSESKEKRYLRRACKANYILYYALLIPAPFLGCIISAWFVCCKQAKMERIRRIRDMMATPTRK